MIPKLNTFPRVKIPDTLLASYLKANWIYPQVDHGIRIVAGSKAMELLLAGDLQWKELPRLKPTREQIGRIASSAAVAHERNGVPCQMGKRSLAPVYNRRRLRKISTAWISNTRPVTEEYASAVLTEPNPTPRTLFERLENGEGRPEAVALGAMWWAAADLSLTGRGAEISSDYKQALRAGEELPVARRQLLPLRAHLAQNLPAAAQAACEARGVPPIPKETVVSFTAGLILGR